jgi:hypothetical protein
MKDGGTCEAAQHTNGANRGVINTDLSDIACQTIQVARL